MIKVQKTYSTPQVAAQIGVSYPTLHRWLAARLVRPSVAIRMGKKTLWRWTAADVRRVRKVKGSQKPGPKPRKRK
jgi:predicted site-specific integrase-resolvase